MKSYYLLDEPCGGSAYMHIACVMVSFMLSLDFLFCMVQHLFLGIFNS